MILRTLPALVLMILFGGLNNAFATHVMGGDLTYKHISDSTYELKFLIYRDCNNGQANIDQNITYWVYYKKTKKVFITNRRISLSSKGAFNVNPEAPNCVVPSGVCIEAGEYVDTVTLGGDPDGYIVTWYRHERNHAIDNLRRCVSSSDNTSCNPTFWRPCNTSRNNPFGMVWTAEIPSYKFKNSSPQFLTAPVPYFCKGTTNYFNHVAFDPDGDSLYFENVTPLSPEACLAASPNPSQNNPPEAYSTVYKNVVYQSGYSVTKPFGTSSATIKVNGATGEITANPTNSGNYVIAIKISEYRVDPVTKKSTYLGAIRRDLQFIAGTCPSNTPPKLTSGGKTVYRVDPDSTLKFTFSGSDNQDTLHLKATGNVFGGTGSNIASPPAVFRDTSGFKKVSQEFSWTPTCDHITYTSPHVFSIFLSDEGCNTLQRTFSVYVNPKPILTPPKINCAHAKSNTAIEINWDKATNIATAFKQYNLYRRDPDGTRALIKTITDSSTTTYTDNTVTDAYSKLYRYYLKTENVCDLPGLPSDSLQNVVIRYTETNDKEGKLTWTKFSPTGQIRYIVQKKIVNAFVNIDTTNSQELTITGCDIKGTYRVISNVSGNPTTCTSASNEVVVTTEDKTGPLAANLKYATYNDWTRIRLELDKSSSTDIDEYRINRSTNAGTFSTIATLSSGASQITYIDNLSNKGNNSFCYEVVSVDECGNVGDTSVLHCPVNLKGKTGQLESVLEWDNYKGFDHDSVIIQRYDTIGKSWKRLVGLGSNSTTYKDQKDIVCNYKYTYRLITREKNGNFISLSDSVSVRPIDTIKPPEVNTVTTAITSDSTALVAFVKSSDDDVNQYMIVSQAYDGGNFVTADTTYIFNTVDDTITQAIKTPRADSFQYAYRIHALDSCNENKSATSEEHRTVQLGGTPLNLSVQLDWTPYTGFTVAQYLVQQHDGTKWVDISSVLPNISQFVHNNLPCNVEQRYRVISIGNPLLREVSSSDEIRLTPYDSLPPASPVINFVTVESDTSIRINWNHSTSGDAQNYIVRYSVNGSSEVVLDTITRDDNLTTHSYVQTGIDTRKNVYCYDVIAYDTCNQNLSLNNQSHCAMQLSGTAGNKETRLTWTPYYGLTVNQYEIQQYNGTAWSTVATVGSNTNAYTHSGLDCYKPYTYRIRMVETGSNPDESLSDTIVLTPFDTIAPAPPTLRSVSVISQDTIEVKWAHSVDNDVDRYVVFMKHPDSSGLHTMDTLGYQTSYKIKVNDASRSYCFALKAIDFCRNNTSTFSKSHCSISGMASQDNCNNHLDLTWSAYAFENGLDKYEVYRSVNGGAFKLLTSTTRPEHRDNVSPHHTYQYQIRGIETGGAYDAYSNIFDGIPYATAVPVVKNASVSKSDDSNGEITIQWEGQTKAPHVTSQKLYYKAASSANYTLLANNIPTTDSSYTHSGINTKTLNHQYFLVNQDSCGNVSDTLSIHMSMDLTFTIGQLTHDLEWTKYEGFNVSTYYVQQLVGSQFVNTDTVPASDDELLKFPAPCNTVITYRIVAESATGYQAISDTASGLAIDLTTPDKPVVHNLSIPNTTHSTINFTGVDSQDVFAYAIMRSRDGNAFQNRGFVNYPGVKQKESFNDTSLVSKGPFCYVVVALDSCLNANPSDTFCTAHLKGAGRHFSNYLSWTHFKGYDIGKYRLEYLDGISWSTLQDFGPTDTNYTHANIGCNQIISYRLMAVSTNGLDTTYSNRIALTPIDTTTPDKPVVYYATVNDNGNVELKWDYDPSSDVKTYNVYRSENGGPFSFLDDTIFSDTYVDKNLDTRNNMYSYYVEAIDSCDVTHISPISDTIGTFNFQLGKDTCDPSSSASWTSLQHLNGKPTKYIIHRSVSGSGVWTPLDTVPGDSLNVEDVIGVRNENYCFRIEALNENSGYSSFTDTLCQSQSIFNEPLAPEVIWASVDSSDASLGRVEIKWNMVDRKSERNFLNYQVMYSDTANGIFNIIGTPNNREDTTWVDTTNTKSKQHFYRVLIVNSCGVSGDSSFLHSPIQLKVGGLNAAAELSWTEYFGFPVKEYQVERSSNGSPYQTIGTVGSEEFDFVDTEVNCGDLLNYRVSAINDRNPLIRTYSDVEITLGTDTLPPATNSLVNVSTANTGNDFEISWNSSPEADVRSYTVIARLKGTLKWDTVALDVVGTSTVVSSITPKEGEVYEFKVTPKDSCGNGQKIYSIAHQSIGLTASGTKGYSELRWNNYLGWKADSFIVYRDGIRLLAMDVRNASQDSIFEVNDSVSACDPTTYSYYVEAVSATGLVSISNYDTTLVTDVTDPTRIYLKTATVLEDGSGISVSWTKHYGVEKVTYVLQSKDANGEWADVQEYDESTTSTVVNSDFDKQRTCFRILVQDVCENRSKASNEACVVLLKGGNIAQANSIRWTPYTTWRDSVEKYVVYRSVDTVNWYPIVELEDRIRTYVDTNLFEDIFTYCYRVEAFEKTGGFEQSSTSNTVCISQTPIVYIPNVFTPGVSSEINDAFGPRGAFLPDMFTMKIYSRWGQRVYITKSGQDWNGRLSNGELAPLGVYLYVVTYTGADGSLHQHEGSVKLIR